MQNVVNSPNNHKRWIRLLQLAVLSILLMSVNLGRVLAQKATQQANPQQTYASPQEAIQVLVSAVKMQDPNQLILIFGPDAKEILYSGDDVADKQTREEFVEKYDQMHRLVTDTNGTVTLYIGADNWPFPIPLVKKNGVWLFDTAAGKKDILYRRIGRNEFDTIDTLHALVDAQKEYASKPRDNEAVKQYAQKLLSDEGKHDGLYWNTKEGEPTSPIGPLIAQAAGQGYSRKQGPVPYHGYIYRLIQSQGSNAPGGAMDYMTDGKLTRGFAIVAYPAEYRNSGVMTFIVNQNGKIYQKDLGPGTSKIASSMKTYNPEKTWRIAE